MEVDSSTAIPKVDQFSDDQLFAYENETRWIFGWNSWIKILKLKLFHDVPVPLSETANMDINDAGTLEETLQNFQASYETASALDSSEHVYELVLALKMWKEVHWQTISLLSFTDQIYSEKCEVYRSFPMSRKVELELNKKRLAESVAISAKKVDKYRNELNRAAAQLKIQQQKNPSGDINPLMALAFKTLFQKNELETKYTADCVKKIMTSLFKDEEKSSFKKRSKFLTIPEFYKPLFVGRNEVEENSPQDFQSKVDYILEILQTGTEWYLGWITFTEEILVDISATLPENISKASLYENTITNGQLALLKGLILEVKGISDRSDKSVLISFLSVLDCFINLLEKTKEESEFWAQNLDRFLTELGEEDVNNVSIGSRINHKLFILKSLVQDKNRHIHISVLFLYKEFNRVIDFIKTEFDKSDERYANLEAITSSLLDQYTENRKEKMGPVPQAKNNAVYPNIEYPENDDLDKSYDLSQEFLMKMSLDENYPSQEESFWSDSLSFGLDENKGDDIDAETLRKMTYFANTANGTSADKASDEQDKINKPQNTPKVNASQYIDGMEDRDALYGPGISPEITAMVEDFNKRLEDGSPSVETPKDQLPNSIQ